MTTTDSIFLHALCSMLAEIFDGPPGQDAYVLNPGDPRRESFAGADYDGSWKRTVASDEQWRTLREALRRDAEAWRTAVSSRASWDNVSASAALSTAAHTAYHMGAIRQILAALPNS